MLKFGDDLHAVFHGKVYLKLNFVFNRQYSAVERNFAKQDTFFLRLSNLWLLELLAL